MRLSYSFFRNLRALFPEGWVNVNDAVDWNCLINTTEFPEHHPKEEFESRKPKIPVKCEYPSKPTKSQFEFPLSFWKKIMAVFSSQIKLDHEAMVTDKFQSADNLFKEKIREIDERNARQLAEHKKQLEVINDEYQIVLKNWEEQQAEHILKQEITFFHLLTKV